MAITKASASATAQRIFDTFDGVRTTTTYTQVTQGEYNPTTGESADTIATKKVKFIFTKFSRDQDNFAQIAPGDIQGIIPKADITFTIATGDKIANGGKNYVVKNWELIAADALYKIHFEETK